MQRGIRKGFISGLKPESKTSLKWFTGFRIMYQQSNRVLGQLGKLSFSGAHLLYHAAIRTYAVLPDASEPVEMKGLCTTMATPSQIASSA